MLFNIVYKMKDISEGKWEVVNATAGLYKTIPIAVFKMDSKETIWFLMFNGTIVVYDINSGFKGTKSFPNFEPLTKDFAHICMANIDEDNVFFGAMKFLGKAIHPFLYNKKTHTFTTQPLLSCK